MAVAFPVAAQDFPNKPVRVIASSSAGGISDIFIRIVGEELHKKWGQPLVVENRPGGQFNIGAKACADAPPDGYTICILPSDVLQYNRHVFKSLNYDLFKDLRAGLAAVLSDAGPGGVVVAQRQHASKSSPPIPRRIRRRCPIRRRPFRTSSSSRASRRKPAPTSCACRSAAAARRSTAC